MNCYRELLLEICDRNESVNAQAAETSDFNIFNVLGVSGKEVIMCRFLSELLNPEGQHGCGILFLKSFLENVLKMDAISDALLEHTSVVKEYVIDDNRRIDISIYNRCFFIPIETKIYAGDQKSQCWDYYEYAKNFDDKARVVYITMQGTIPSECSRKSHDGTEILPDDKVVCISWQHDVYEWLAALITKLEEPIKSYVMKYMEAICLTVGGVEEHIMENCMEVLYESPDFFKAGLEVEKTMKAAKLKLMRLVFEDFKKEMDKVVSKYGLELENNFNYYSYEDISRHEKYYDSSRSTYPGLNYVVKRAKFKQENIQMWFRIEICDNLYAGIALFDTQAGPRDGYTRGYEVSSISEDLLSEASKYLNEDVINPDGWWLTNCYSNGKVQDGYYEDVPDFKEMNACAVSLVESEKRMKFVRNAVGVFERQLLGYLQGA